MAQNALYQWVSELPWADVIATHLAKLTKLSALSPLSSTADVVNEIAQHVSNDDMRTCVEGCITDLTTVMKDALAALKVSQAAMAAKERGRGSTGSKFQVSPMSCGTVEDFHLGLSTRVGECIVFP